METFETFLVTKNTGKQLKGVITAEHSVLSKNQQKRNNLKSGSNEE